MIVQCPCLQRGPDSIKECKALPVAEHQKTSQEVEYINPEGSQSYTMQLKQVVPPTHTHDLTNQRKAHNYENITPKQKQADPSTCTLNPDDYVSLPSGGKKADSPICAHNPKSLPPEEKKADPPICTHDPDDYVNLSSEEKKADPPICTRNLVHQSKTHHYEKLHVPFEVSVNIPQVAPTSEEVKRPLSSPHSNKVQHHATSMDRDRVETKRNISPEYANHPEGSHRTGRGENDISNRINVEIQPTPRPTNFKDPRKYIRKSKQTPTPFV